MSAGAAVMSAEAGMCSLQSKNGTHEFTTHACRFIYYY